MAVNVAHPPVHTVSVSAVMSGLTGHPVASPCAEMGRTQTESQSSRMPVRKSSWMRQLPPISASSAMGRMRASVKPPGQLMLAAAVVSIEGETASEQAGRLEPSAVSPASHTLSVVRSRSKSSWRHRSASRRRVRVAEAGGPELGAATTASERPGRSVPAFDA